MQDQDQDRVEQVLRRLETKTKTRGQQPWVLVNFGTIKATEWCVYGRPDRNRRQISTRIKLIVVLDKLIQKWLDRCGHWGVLTPASIDARWVELSYPLPYSRWPSLDKDGGKNLQFVAENETSDELWRRSKWGLCRLWRTTLSCRIFLLQSAVYAWQHRRYSKIRSRRNTFAHRLTDRTSCYRIDVSRVRTETSSVARLHVDNTSPQRIRSSAFLRAECIAMLSGCTPASTSLSQVVWVPSCTGRVHDRVHGCVHAPCTSVHGRKHGGVRPWRRQCTSPARGRVHGPYNTHGREHAHPMYTAVYTTVHTAAYGPCTLNNSLATKQQVDCHRIQK